MAPRAPAKQLGDDRSFEGGNVVAVGYLRSAEDVDLEEEAGLGQSPGDRCSASEVLLALQVTRAVANPARSFQAAMMKPPATLVLDLALFGLRPPSTRARAASSVLLLHFSFRGSPWRSAAIAISGSPVR